MNIGVYKEYAHKGCTKWTLVVAETYYQILTCTRHLVRGTTLAVRAKSSVDNAMP